MNFLNLADGIKIIRTSALYETEPWGVKEQNWFLNIAVEIKTSLSPQDLMVKCLNIEQMLGRNREKETRWGERPIDIDIIFYDNALIDSDTSSPAYAFEGFCAGAFTGACAGFCAPCFE